MNYGELNLPTIAPSSPVSMADRIRPAWLCITAPEHAERGISEKDIPDLTSEQIAEAEAEELRRETTKALKKQALQDERERIKAAKKRTNDAAREVISRATQDARKAKEHIPTIGEYIHNFRVMHKLSKNALAKLLHCSEPSIGNWERGKCIPRMAIMERLAELDKTIGYQ